MKSRYRTTQDTAHTAASATERRVSEARRVLQAWTALEVLSPVSFRRPESLAEGREDRIVRFASGLPWEVQHRSADEEAPQKRFRTYYQIVLGAVSLAAAESRLLTVYPKKKGFVSADATANGYSVIATIVVNDAGIPLEKDGVAISSFAWALPRALAGDLKTLGAWQRTEESLVERLREVAGTSTNRAGKTSGLTGAGIAELFAWIVRELGLSDDLVIAPSFAVKCEVPIGSQQVPETLVLNSFYLADLEHAQSLFASGAAPIVLQRYLGALRPTSRVDILRDDAALAAVLHPTHMPLGKWPEKTHSPLVAMQQAAVNLAAAERDSQGILAVNGAPGTGKTTLLRDVVAHCITERAQMMVTCADPEEAFQHSGERIKKGNAFLSIYRVDARLRGFEMIVASSNNGAVENVSAELPNRGSVAPESFAEGYFNVTSDGLLETETWGLIAAVLGNGSNRAKFRQRFWWDDDTGMSRYLQHCMGAGSTGAGTGQGERPSRVISEQNPPRSKQEALERWRTAQERYRRARAAAEDTVDDARRWAVLPRRVAVIGSQKRKIKEKLSVLHAKERQLGAAHAAVTGANQSAVRTLLLREEEHASAALRKPH